MSIFIHVNTNKSNYLLFLGKGIWQASFFNQPQSHFPFFDKERIIGIILHSFINYCLLFTGSSIFCCSCHSHKMLTCSNLQILSGFQEESAVINSPLKRSPGIIYIALYLKLLLDLIPYFSNTHLVQSCTG